VHQTSQPWAFQLDGRQAVTLLAERAPRWLRVDSGRVWITARDGGPDSDDIWLDAGQSLALPGGSAWVLEAWPDAQLSLLQAAPAAFRRAAAASRPARRGWWPWWSWSSPSLHGA
jgi:Protein of unknown function (DUF2917)